MSYKLIFPTLQYLEGKTISQCFMVDVLRQLKHEDVDLVAVDLQNMEAEIEGEIDLDRLFIDYVEGVIDEAMANYSYTMGRIRQGEAPRNIADSRFAEESLRRIGTPTEGRMGRQEKELLFRIDNLYKAKDTPYRPFQTEEEVASGKEACPACGLVDGGRDTITSDISLSADKARLGMPGRGYENLEECRRCATAVKAVSGIRLLWRVVMVEKRGQETVRHTFVPTFRVESTEPQVLEEISTHLEHLSNFRVSRQGQTATDFIYNSFRAQPVIGKLVAEGRLGLTYYSRSGSGIKTSVTDSVTDMERVRRIAQFAHTLNTYFPTDWFYASSKGKARDVDRVLSDSARLYSSKSRDQGLRNFFWALSRSRWIPFITIIQVTTLDTGVDRGIDGEERSEMRKEYLLDVSSIGEMDEFWWGNPLVRLSTFFVAELAGAERRKEEAGRPPDQVVNQCMAELDEFPEREKASRIRRYVEKITSKGNSYLLHSLEDNLQLLNAFQEALYACTPHQLKEIVRNMRIYAMSYIYEKKESKDTVFKETMEELGFRIKEKKEKK